MTALSAEQLAVLRNIDDVWVMFDEIWPYVTGVPKRDVAAIVRGLVARGYVDSRRSDAHGRVEYAITEAGDKELRFPYPSLLKE
jgi:hypothetical protein